MKIRVSLKYFVNDCGLKKIGFLYPLNLFGGREEKEWYDLVCVCVYVAGGGGASLDDWANGGDTSSKNINKGRKARKIPIILYILFNSYILST